MQGDWWSHGLHGRQNDRYSKYSSSSNTWAAPTSKATTPKIVTLTVQPLAQSTQSFRHCNHNHVGITSAENILAQAQRRKRLNMKQKASFCGKRPVSMGAQSDQQESEQCDLTWSNFFERHLTNNATNSPYGGQDVNSTSSSGPLSTSKDVTRHGSSDDFRTLERKLEKERERRTHLDASPPRIDSKVLGDDIPNVDLTKVNGVRASKKDTLFSRSNQQSQQHSIHRSPSYRNSLVRDNLTTMGPSSNSASLRGHSIGFGNKDGQSLRSPTHKGRLKGTMVVPHGHANDRLRRSKYQYPDPNPGAIPSFQQRLSELSSLESDTIRYERAKKSKRKTKQEKE